MKSASVVNVGICDNYSFLIINRYNPILCSMCDQVVFWLIAVSRIAETGSSELR